MPEVSKHYDDSTITQDVDDMISSTNSPMNNESLLETTNSQVEGEIDFEYYG